MAAPTSIKKVGVGDKKIAKKRQISKAITEKEKTTHSLEKHTKKDTFTELEFKLSLRDSNTIFSGFEKFVEECEKWPEESDYDLVAGYCRSSPECVEIFQVLEAGKRKVPELHLIFGSLEKILLRIADDLDDHHAVGLTIVRKLLATQIGSILFTLRITNKSSHIKTSLKLLVAMVILGPSSAKSVLTRVDLTNPCIKALFNRRDTKDEEDVRTCLIHLVVAFLLSGDNETIRTLASIKDCLANMFHGVVFDRLPTVQLILSTVLEKVVKNTTVSKTSKIHVFTETSLKQLAMLYSWKGPAKWKESQVKGHKVEVDVDSVPTDDQMLLAETVHAFLGEVCTSVKYGIVFVDKSYGISGKNQNHTLTGFFCYLNTLSQNALVPDLIVKILSAAPDQTRHFLPHLTHSLSPRPTDKWVNNMRFLYKVYEALPTGPHVLSVREARPTQQLVDILMVYTTPTPQVLNTFLPGVKNKVCTVWYTCLQMVRLMAERAASILKVLSDHGPDSILAAVYSTDELTDIVDAYKDTVLKSLPESLVIFQCWDKSQQLQKDISDATEKQVAELQELCGAGIADTRVCIEQVLCLYQALVPSLLTDHPAGLGRLLDGIVTDGPDSGQSRSDGQVLSQMYLLKLLAGTDARRIPWSKESQSGHTLMYQLLGMVARVTDNRLGHVSLQLLCKLLESTGLFDHCLDELDVWLGQLQASVQTSPAPDLLLGYVAKVFMTYMNNPFLYMSQVADIVSEAVAMETQGDMSSGKNSDAYIQEILSMEQHESLEDNTDTSKNGTAGEDEVTATSQQTRYPFSPVFCTAMELLQKFDSHDVGHYISSVTLRLFHLQDDPRPFCLFVKSLDATNLVEGLQPFVLSWLPGGKVPKKCPKKILPLCGGFTSQLIQHHHGDRVTLDSAPDPGHPNLQATVKTCLLYVTYYLSQETKISSADGARKLGPILTSITSALRQWDGCPTDDEATSLSLGTDAKLAADFTQLQPAQVTMNEQLRTVIKDILNHECIHNCFKAEFSHTVSDSKTMMAMCESVVRTLNDIFNIANEHSLAVVDALGFYITTVVSAMKSDNADNLHEIIRSILNHGTAFDCLQYLITFMDTENCVDILEGVLAIPEDKLTVNIGVLVEYVLRRLEIHTNKGTVQVGEACLNNLLLYIANNITDGDLTDAVMRVFRSCPNLAVLCSRETFLELLNKAVRKVPELASLLIAHNVRLCNYFSELITKSGFLTKANCIEYLPVVVTYATVMKPDSAAGMAVATLYKSRLLDLCKEAVDTTPGTVDSLCQLFKQLLSHRLIDKKAVKKMMTLLQQTFEDKSAIRCHHVHVIVTILGCQATGVAVAAGNRLRTELLHLCVKALGKCMELKTSRDVQLENLLLDKLSTFTEDEVTTLRSSYFSQTDTWPHFLKSTLKYLYKDPRMLRLLVQLIRALYTEDDGPASVTIETIVSMVMSHSTFLPVMFNEECPDAKEPLLDLLLELLERSPASCQQDHVGVLLGAYGTTLSIVDQKILKLLHLYEKNGIDFTSFQPYLWGSKAVEHHSLLKPLGPSLLKQPRMVDVVNLLVPDIVHRTILHFPLRRKLQGGEPVEASEYKSEPCCYDPGFILPLFSHLLGPGSLVDCRKFADCDCLGFTIAALSSHDRHMRTAAYHVLDLYEGHLAGAKFLEKEQIAFLLQCLRNSVAHAGKKLSCIVTVFLARIAKIMLHPDDHMYGVMNTFLLLKPSMDVLNVPEFYKLFNSSDIEYKAERTWMLTLLLDGLRETGDYRLYEKRYTFKLLQSFYGSNLADVAAQVKVLQIITAACKEKSIAMDMWRNHGIVVWLTGVVQKLSPDMGEHVAEVIQTVSSLWFSVLGKKEYSRETSSEKARCLPPMFTGQMLSLVQSVLWYLRDMPITTTQVYVNLLNSVLQHVGHTTEVLKSTNTNLTLRGLTPCDTMLLLFHTARCVPSRTPASSFLNVISGLGFSTEKLVQPKTSKYVKKNVTRQSEATLKMATSESNDGHKLPGPGDVDMDVTSTLKDVGNVRASNDANSGEVNRFSDQRRSRSDFADAQSDQDRHCSPLVDRDFLNTVVWIVLQVDLDNLRSPTTTPETCACLLLIIQWLLGQVSRLDDVQVLSDICTWVQRNITTGADEHGNTLIIQTLSQSSDLTDDIIQGLLDLYARLENLTAILQGQGNSKPNDGKDGDHRTLDNTCRTFRSGEQVVSGSVLRSTSDSVHTAVSSVNKVLFTVATERLELGARTWQTFCDSQGETTTEVSLTEKEKSIILRKYFLRKHFTIRANVPATSHGKGEKRKADHSWLIKKTRRSVKRLQTIAKKPK